MADYYSLLSRAIANLPKSSTPLARKAIYDRARKALNNQLRSLKPPLPESDIAREETSLDAAVQRLEAELDPTAAAAAPPPQPQAPPQPASAPPPVPPPPRPQTPVAPPAPAAETRPPLKPPSAVAPPRPTAPPVAAAPPKAPISAPLAPPIAARPTLPRADEKPSSAPLVDASVAPEAAAPPIAAPLSRESQIDDGAPPLKPTAPLGPPRDADSARPNAPRPEDEGGSGLWKWGILAGVAGLVAVVAVGAYVLRSQRPQDLAIKEPKVTVATPDQSATPNAGSKINERVGGSATTAPTTEPTPDASATPSPEATPGATPTVAATPTPTTTAIPSTPMIPGGDRAAMLLAAPQDVQKPTVFVGNVTWSSPPPAPGQGGGPGVRADIDIPDLKMHATMLMRKNVDPSLPASHTIDLRVSFDDGAQFKGLKDVGVPQMRRDEPAAVTPLLGVRVVINDTYFLIGLNRADTDQQHNLDAIGQSGWFDFPMLLPDGRIGKLTFEKGADGEKLVNAALAAWK